jgi:hypothetical protein
MADYRHILFKCLAPIFLGSGIGLLISPAFVEEMIWWNNTGFLLLPIGVFFAGKMFDG